MTTPNGGDGLEHHMKEELIRTKSAVRVLLTVVGGGVMFTIILYGALWMHDDEAAIAGIAIGNTLVAFWFGERSQQHKNGG